MKLKAVPKESLGHIRLLVEILVLVWALASSVYNAWWGGGLHPPISSFGDIILLVLVGAIASFAGYIFITFWNYYVRVLENDSQFKKTILGIMLFLTSLFLFVLVAGLIAFLVISIAFPVKARI